MGPPKNSESYLKIKAGSLRVKVDNPYAARLILSIANGEFISREIIRRLELYRYKAADEVNLASYDFNNIIYTLEEPKETSEPGIFSVPLTIYIPPKNISKVAHG